MTTHDETVPSVKRTALEKLLGVYTEEQGKRLFPYSVDYSVNNTMRQVLWLPTTTAMKYQAKQAVDTFFVRMGDVGSAVMVAVLVGALGLGIRAFAVTNVIVIVGWLVLARAILREQKALSERRERGELQNRPAL